MEENGARCRSRMDDIPIPPSPEWRCVRCKLVLPSPDGSGRPPNACLENLGGCSREVDCGHPYTRDWNQEKQDYIETGTPTEGCMACANGHTRFFPADWSQAKTDLYLRALLADWSQAKTDLPLRALLSEGQRLFREMVR